MELLLGRHSVLDALRDGVSLEKVIVSHQVSKSRDGQEVLKEAKRHQTKTQVLSKPEFDRLAKGGNAQGVAAQIREWGFKTLDELIDNIDDYPVIVALDHLEDPHNMGAIFRSCAAFGVKAVIFPKDRQTQITGTVVKTASGAIHHIDLIKVPNLSQALNKLKESAGAWVYGTDVNAGTSVSDVTPSTPMVLIMGNEQKGISKGVMKTVDCKLHIPMSGKIESLNVSVSAGILLYTLTRNL